MPSAVSFLFSSSYGFLCSSFFLITFIFQDKPKPISIYHPTTEELFASTGTPMEGFFEGADVMFRTIASAAPAASQGVSAEAPIPSTKPVPMEGIHTEGLVRPLPILLRHLLLKRGPFLLLPRPKLLHLPHLLSSPSAAPSQLYLRM